MKILITGPQGSGKTTQAEILSKKLNLCLVSVGDLARHFAEKNNSLSEELKNDLDKGDLVSNDVILQLLKERLAKDDCSLGFVSDSYPRSEDQAELYDPGFDKVFYLDLSDDIARERLLKRGREDDTPSAINSRLKWYHTETEPLIKHYQSQGKLIKIDANKSIEEIASEIEKYIKEEK